MANPTAAIPPLPEGRPHGSPRSPLTPVLVFTALNSLGTGAVQTGVFFLLRSAYDFGARDNFVFGIFLYASYIAGALAIGPMLRRRTGPDRVPRRGPFARLSTRAVLTLLVLVQASLSLLPQIAAWIAGVRTPGVWAMWVVGLGFGVLSGMMWPIVESFLSGGRRGADLSRATGKFNIVWSASVVAAFWLMAPLLEDRPIGVLTALGVAQALSVLCLIPLSPEPARHLEGRHEPHPAHWARLLVWFRVLLPVGYVLCGAISPLLPTAIARLGIEGGWMTPVASAWVTSRVVVFLLFERWGGWHGKRWMPWLAGLGLVGGFICAVIAPGWIAQLVPGWAGVGILMLSLAVFGVGHATAYVGALYYAMELGDAEVDAGGTHEALIGVGYGMGPVLGLGAIAAAGAPDTPAFEGWLVALVLVVALGAIGVAARPRSLRARPDSDR